MPSLAQKQGHGKLFTASIELTKRNGAFINGFDMRSPLSRFLPGLLVSLSFLCGAQENRPSITIEGTQSSLEEELEIQNLQYQGALNRLRNEYRENLSDLSATLIQANDVDGALSVRLLLEELDESSEHRPREPKVHPQAIAAEAWYLSRLNVIRQAHGDRIRGIIARYEEGANRLIRLVLEEGDTAGAVAWRT